jgi:hypothetical protein
MSLIELDCLQQQLNNKTLINMNKELDSNSKNSQKINEIYGYNILEDLNEFIMQLNGLCNMFTRWKNFNLQLNQIDKAFSYAKEEKYKVQIITEEKIKADLLKNEFTQKILSEVKIFNEKFKKFKTIIISNICEYLGKLTVTT